MKTTNRICLVTFLVLLMAVCSVLAKGKQPPPWQTPSLPDGKLIVTDTSEDFIKVPDVLDVKPGENTYQVATTAPTIDFMFFPGQTYKGKPWSAWGNGCVHNGKYYAAIGDHEWRALVYEYDPKTKALRLIVDVKEFLNMPAGHYTPGKIHSFITPGKDGWLYFATHNAGKARAAPKYHYKGDWIIRHDPRTGTTRIVAHPAAGPVSMPVGFLDPERMIFYAGTEGSLFFLAYDVVRGKLLYRSPDKQGPSRNMLFSSTTGRVYYRARGVDNPFMTYDPKKNRAREVKTDLDPRCSSSETPDGKIYSISWDGNLWEMDIWKEKPQIIAYAPIAKQTYTTTLAVDPTGRYLYYNCGAHGGAEKEGTAIVQFDLKTKRRKVIAFLTPFYPAKYGYTCKGTYSLVVSGDGSALFITWNGNRTGTRGYCDVCAMTVIHIPESERRLD